LAVFRKMAELPESRSTEQTRRLGLLCQHFYPEMKSTGPLMTELVTSLAERSWRLRVYCARPTGPISEAGARDWPGHPGVEIVRVPALGRHEGNLLARLLFALTYVSATAVKVMRDRRELAGLIVTTNPPFVGLVGLLMKRFAGFSYVQIVHDLFPDSMVEMGLISARSPATAIWRKITSAGFRGSALVIAIGRDMTEIIQSILGSQATKVVTIANWSDESKVWPVPRAENQFIRAYGLAEKLVVQYSGNLGRNHNIECLIDAAKLLSDDPRVVFQFIGGGAKRALIEQKARAAGLANVQFLPLQPVANLAAVLSAAHLGVVALGRPFTGLSVPSKAYGIMASGVPMLALVDERSEIGRTVIENRCGLVVPDADGAKVASIVRDLARQPRRYAELGANGRRAFLSHYTLSKAVDCYAAALDQAFRKGAEDCDGAPDGRSAVALSARRLAGGRALGAVRRFFNDSQPATK
jgi:colanic acid biosynthesis glycosyl transferase WcaI